MKKTLIAVLSLAAGLLTSACASHTQPETAGKPTMPSIHDIGAAYWAESLRVSPTWATYLGDRSHDADLPDVSWKAHQAHIARLRELQAQLESVQRESLSDSDRISYDILAHELTTTLNAEVCKRPLWNVDHMGGWQSSLAELPGYHTITTRKNADDLAARYRGATKLFADTTANLTMGLESGYVAPRMNVERTIEQIDRQLAVDPADSPYLVSAEQLPEDWSAQTKKEVRAMLLQSIEEGVYPGLKHYRDFLEKNVLPRSRKTVGVSAIPNGAECYQALIQLHTGTKMTADEIHELGLSEVERIRAAMMPLVEKDGGTEDIAAYFASLKKRKDQHFSSRKALRDYNARLVKRAQAALPRAFGKLPETPIEMKEIEDFRAAESPAAYYYGAPLDGSRPAYYYINTYKPEERPLYNMAALAFHEAVPGHHLQISLTNENQSLPEYQRHIGQTAFVEGWALYAEGLSDDLGLYETDYEKLGMYNYELWRAVRLVVDTGMHSKGWTRQQAIDYLAENTGNPHEEVVNEIDRYITWPGQALAYKIGQLEIRRLRAKAERQLGDRFDLRAFHDRVLMHGAIPLPTLAADINRWIDDQQQAGTEGTR